MKNFYLPPLMCRLALCIACMLPLVTVVDKVCAQQPQYTTNFATSATPSGIPFSSSTNNKAQWVYLHSDFASAPSGYISKIYFRAEQSMLPVICNFTDFTIKMGQTTMTLMPPGPWITAGMTTVFAANSFNVWPITPGNWMPVQLQTPFLYDNTKNFIVEASQMGYAVGFNVMQGAYNARSLYGHTSSLMGNSQNFLCDFGFDMTQGSTDASLIAFSGISDTICSGFQPVVVTLKNNGPSTLTSTTLNWTINNVTQPAFSWTGSLGVNATTNVTLGSFNFLPATTYSLLAFSVNPNNLPDNNTSNDTLLQTILLVKQSPSAAPTATSYVMCAGDSVLVSGTLTGTPPWHVVVSDGSTTYNYPNLTLPFYGQYLSPATTTTYTIVSVTDATGCSSTATPPVIVTVNPLPNAVITPQGPTEICPGNTISFLATPGSGFAYVWYRDGIVIPAATQHSYATGAPGVYTVKITTPAGCSSTSPAVTVSMKPAPTVNLGPDQSMKRSHTITLDAGAGYSGYLWSTAATTQTISVNGMLYSPGIHPFSVTVTNSYGCTGADTVLVTVVNDVGIDDPVSQRVSLFPNPAGNHLWLALPWGNLDQIRIDLYQPDGTLLPSPPHLSGTGETSACIDLSGIPTGIYILKVRHPEGSSQHKLVIIR